MPEKSLRAVMRRVFRRDFDGENVAVADVPGWDSLTHIKLVMELEREFGFSITPSEIPEIFKDYDAVRQLVIRKLGGIGRAAE